MPRPMVLIKEPLLKQVYLSNQEGVPISKLLIKHHIPITAPTLAKLLNFYEMAVLGAVSENIKTSIKASLFPEWLLVEAGNVARQNLDWSYRGAMPFGIWEYNPKEIPLHEQPKQSN